MNNSINENLKSDDITLNSNSEISQELLQEYKRQRDIYISNLRDNRKPKKYRGVSWKPLENKWGVMYKGKRFGAYVFLSDAIEAYDNEIIKIFGEYGITNKFLIEIGHLNPVPKENINPILIQNLPNEIWKDIDGYNGIYQVSSMGRVKSRQISPKGILTGEKLRKFGNCRGYYFVPLNLDCDVKNHRVNRLVAIAFHPNLNNLPQVNHKNLDKLDNRAENLEWCDESHNQRHARANKVFKKALGNAKINQEKANEIRELYKTGKYTQNQIGELFNLAGRTVGLIIQNRRWKE